MVSTAGGVGQMGAAFPGAGGRGFAAGVGDLNGRHGAVFFDEAVDAGDRLDVFVVPDAGVAGGDAALGRNGGGLGDDQARAAHGP